MLMRFFQVARWSGVSTYGLMSLELSFCGANGGGAVGNGWVGHAASPGIRSAEHRRSSIGQIGSPVTRRRTRTGIPSCPTARRRRIVRPFRRTVVSCGAAVFVVVPQIVVHHLEVPQRFPVRPSSARRGRSEEIRAMPIGAVIIVGGATRAGSTRCLSPDRS